MTKPRQFIRLSPEVEEAIEADRAVVALESGLLIHGFPRDQQEAAARELEAVIRSAGAVPAIVACLDGFVEVGLGDQTLERLTTAAEIEKVSLSMLPVCLAGGGVGATTIASTAHIAGVAGVRAVAAGGLGGVHHGAADSFDISADPAVLARTPIVVTCAGVKSILDVDATVELLETLGVSVVGLGTDHFPAYYVAETDHRVTAASGPGEVAEVRRAKDAIGSAGAVVAVIPPPPGTAIPRSTHDAILAEAIAEAEAAGVTGSDLSPFLLNRLGEASGGRTRRVAAEIILASAAAAAAVAGELSERR